MRSGDGWVQCSEGHQHWGRFGAAGLLLVAPDDAGTPRVLLQHRAAYSHHGDTWGVPGGARDPHETPEQAALREAAEETGLDVAEVTVTGTALDDHGGWSYTTVLARPARPIEAADLRLDGESTGVAWIAVAALHEVPLHPGLAGSLARLRPLILPA